MKSLKNQLNIIPKVIDKISQSHELYPKAKDGRGIAFERTDRMGY